ncbi:unnamed protein product [Rangifer tarandus platyrhynchus]|uniref:Uncharacterized protein n=1 Tax=Rangifer tarandus platyrhynchus TaxID=3082113 RepID=A0AC59ZMV4_RANTA
MQVLLRLQEDGFLPMSGPLVRGWPRDLDLNPDLLPLCSEAPEPRAEVASASWRRSQAVSSLQHDHCCPRVHRSLMSHVPPGFNVRREFTYENLLHSSTQNTAFQNDHGFCPQNSPVPLRPGTTIGSGENLEGFPSCREVFIIISYSLNYKMVGPHTE